MDISAMNLNYWILQSIAMGITALLLPKLRITGFFGATGMVICLALVNAHIWDAALFFSVPDSLSSHALTLLIANGAIFWILVKVLPGIEIDGVFTALIAPIIFSVCSYLIGQYGQHIDFITLGRHALDMITEARNDLAATKTPSALSTPLGEITIAPTE